MQIERLILKGGNRLYRCAKENCRNNSKHRGYFETPAKTRNKQDKIILHCPHCFTILPIQVEV